LPTHPESLATFNPSTAFFRPDRRTARDLGILAARRYRRRYGQLRVVEPMAASGVRSLRYALEAEATSIWANDGDGDVLETLTQNLTQNLPVEHPHSPDLRVTNLSALQVLGQCIADPVDWIDLDPFGSVAPFLGLALAAIKPGGVVYITATDGRSLAGHEPIASLRGYGAFARSHPSCQEQALRILIGSLAQQAASQGYQIQPILSYHCGQTYRVMVQRRDRLDPHFDRHLGFLGYCHSCGNYAPIDWKKLGRSRCTSPSHGPEPQPWILTGPMWLGPLQDPTWLTELQTDCEALIEGLTDTAFATGRDRPSPDPQDLAAWRTCRDLLALMIAEASLPPWFFRLGDIGKRGKMDPPPRDRLLALLQARGYAASPTHLDRSAIKTTASLDLCIELARELAQELTQELP
jgi:tRNA (guanine26-N2/guanine27-N2)-dimethyltransferase